MLHMNLIFARGLNYEFSLKDGSLPWKNHDDLTEDCRLDMLHFRNLTMNNIILMGFNTYKTFTKPLPGRINVVIDKYSTIPDNIKTDDFNFFPDVESALTFFKSCSKQIYLIGGANLIEQCISKNLVTGIVYETIFNKSFIDSTTFVNPLPPMFNHTNTIPLGKNSKVFCYKCVLNNSKSLSY